MLKVSLDWCKVPVSEPDLVDEKNLDYLIVEFAFTSKQANT